MKNKFPLISLITLLCTTVVSCDDSSSNIHINDIEADAVYQVNKADLNITLTEGIEGDEDFVAWNIIREILPEDGLKKYVAEYHAFTDGKDETLAYVTTLEDDDTKWIYSVDYEDSSDTSEKAQHEFIHTIIHEYSHILSLNVNQVDRNYSACTTYEITEGCSKENAYLYDFYKKFWDNESHAEYLETIKDLSEKDTMIETEAFYDDNSSTFVNDYSATNPPEDFAESFAFFVLSDKTENPTTIKEEKVNFFYDYPKMVELREYIRARTNVRQSF